MRSRRSVAFVTLAGVVIAHALDFVLVYPGHADREQQLLATGHGYWPVAIAVAVLAALAALVLATGAGASRGLMADGDRSRAGRSVVRNAVHLAVAQVALFACVELVERAAVGAAPTALLQAPEFAVGLLLQVVVAAVAVVVLTVLERLAEDVVRAAASARKRPSPRGAARRPTAVPSVRAALVVTPARPRAPPLAASL